MVPFQHRQLLAEYEVLKDQIPALWNRRTEVTYRTSGSGIMHKGRNSGIGAIRPPRTAAPHPGVSSEFSPLKASRSIPCFSRRRRLAYVLLIDAAAEA